MMNRDPVGDGATDYDIFEPAYAVDPTEMWKDMRSACPVAHTDRNGGSWMPVTFEAVSAAAHDHERFSSNSAGVGEPGEPADGSPRVLLPPIESDPPEHHWARRMLLPAFSPKRVAERYEPFTRNLVHQLIDGFIDAGQVDAATQYSQQISPRVIGHLLGVPEELTDTFVGWVRGYLELGLEDDDIQLAARNAIFGYFSEIVAERAADPSGSDLVSEMIRFEVDDERVPAQHVVRTCMLILVAGIDTTWSAIGSALYHLATHPDDRQRLVADPALIPVAVEEILRVYAPVMMGRIVTSDTEFEGCPMSAGDRVLLSFGAANRDPAVFADPDKVVIDRARNRHLAFGAGIHRCAGSNQARVEMRVALEVWLDRIPEFRVENADAIVWASGQVRGPRKLSLVF